MTQQTMFDDFDRQRMVQPDRPIKPPHNGTETSKAAAEKVATKTTERREMIYAFIADQGESGAINNEIANEFGLEIQSVCPRVNELAKQGLIVKNGTRENANGNRCTIWRAV